MTELISNPDAERPVHVFVVGISRYRHLDDGTDPTPIGGASGLRQLSSAARSASEFAGWALENIPQNRLASLYVNLAPAENEQLHPDVSQLLPAAPTAVRKDVVKDWEAFYHACARDNDAIAYIYVAGHGVQLGIEGAILLLEDFGAELKPKLWAALDLVGMSKTLRGAAFANLQYWFIDCCREAAEAADYDVAELRRPYMGFDIPQDLCTAAPVFFATFPREMAWAKIGGVSLFNEGLLNALRKEAAAPPQGASENWCVTTSSLARALNDHVVRASGDLSQKVHLSGHMGTTNEVLHEYSAPPLLDLTITLQPEAAYEVASANIDQDDTNIVADAREWPIKRELPGGMYIVHVHAQPDYPDATRAHTLTPQDRAKEVTLT